MIHYKTTKDFELSNAPAPRPNDNPRILHRAKTAVVLVAIAVGFISIGCVSGSFTHLTDQRFPAREATAPIEVLDQLPTRPNIRIGNATVGMGVGHEEERCLDELKNEARKVGGDAIANYSFFMAPPGTVNQGTSQCRATVYRWMQPR